MRLKIQPLALPRRLTCIGVVPHRACGSWPAKWKAMPVCACVFAWAAAFMLPSLRQACGASLGQTQLKKTVGRSNKQITATDARPKIQQEQQVMPLRLSVATSSRSITSTCANMLTAATQNDQLFAKDKLWLQALRKLFFHKHAAGCAAAAVVYSWVCTASSPPLLCTTFAGPLCYVQARILKKRKLERHLRHTVPGPGVLQY